MLTKMTKNFFVSTNMFKYGSNILFDNLTIYYLAITKNQISLCVLKLSGLYRTHVKKAYFFENSCICENKSVPLRTNYK